MNTTYDVVIIGGGPAGYVAAIRCAQLGLHTVCIDGLRDHQGKSWLGGTCLNVGCIPSKALLESSELYLHAKVDFAEHGITASGLSFDVAKMQERKQKIVRAMAGGIDGLFKSNGVEWLQGHGCLIGSGKVAFTPHDQQNASILEAKNIILASGSKPVDIQSAPQDHKWIVDSSGALEFSQIPRRLGIVGAGVIGLELGSVWRRLGSEVIILEAQPCFLPIADHDIADSAERFFRQQGLDIRLGSRLRSTIINDNDVLVHYDDQQGSHEIHVDRLVVAVGRRPNTDGLFAAESQLNLDDKGFVDIDNHCRTNLPHVYAIGDVVPGPMLAHKGSEEGIYVAETIAGMASHINYDIMPSVIYTTPEIAWVGRTENDLKESGLPYHVGRFPYAANGRARAFGTTDGMVKVLSHAHTDQILGVHIIGHMAGELLGEAVLAMEFSASAEDLARTIHAHPTLSETLHEAALAVDGRAIHIRNPKSRS